MAMVVPESPEPLRTARTFRIRVAGAESNVAMYLAALGHRAAWAGRVGDDPLGERLLDEIASAGVDVRLVERDREAPTGVFFKDPGPAGTRVFYYRRSSAAARMTDDLVGRILAQRPKVVHVSGITPALSRSCAELVRALVQGRGAGDPVLSFDVNYRPALWPPGRAAGVLRDLAQASDIVFVGMDEARALWGSGTPRDVRALVDQPHVLVVKNGDQGATEYRGDGGVFVPSLKVDPVEPIGAGDAFAAGWLSGELGGMTTVQRLRLGHLLAATAMGSMSDFTRLPSRQTLDSALRLTDEGWSGWTLGVSPASDGIERASEVVA